MSYSDIVSTISGILQFVVACYALRVSRIFGIARVGWVFFGAFSLLAVIHMLISVQAFGLKLEPGPGVNIMYVVISVLLLANIAQMEALLWRRRQKLKAEQKTQSEGELKINQQITELTKAKEVGQQIIARLQTEAAQLTQTLEQEKQAHAQAALAQAAEFEKNFQEQLAAGRKAEEELRTIAASLQGELVQQKQSHDREKEAHEAALKTYEELLTAGRQSEAELQTTVSALTAELANRPAPDSPSIPPSDPALSYTAAVDSAGQHQEALLNAARQTEDELRSTIADLEFELTEQKLKLEQNESAHRELLTSLRESGIAEVASLAQSRVGYIARITNLMRQHSGDIGAFMTRHPRGKQLPNALSLMIEYLSDEQFLLLKRIDSVKSKLAKITQTSAPKTEAREISSAIPANPEPPAEQKNDEPATAITDPATAAAPADYLSHLIENVTETGTEAAAPSEPTPEPTPSEPAAAEPEAPILVPDLGDLKPDA